MTLLKNIFKAIRRFFQAFRSGFNLLRRYIKRFYRYIKKKFSLTALLSVLAVLISMFTMYFQFFNIKHELLYTFLSPSMPEKMVIPMIYKNTGNQNEMLLDANIELEIIPDDGTPNYFKRIGDENAKLFPLIIAPGEYKVITLLGDYKEYFKGMLERSDSGLKYRRIVNFDTLSVVLTTKFISDNGVSEVRRTIGKVSFKQDRTFERFEFLPIKLLPLKADGYSEMTSEMLVNANSNTHIDFRKPLTADEIEIFKFSIELMEDTTAKREMIKALRKQNIPYP